MNAPPWPKFVPPWLAGFAVRPNLSAKTCIHRGSGFVVKRPVFGGRTGLYQPASIELSPNPYTPVHCADAVPAEHASATALATSALRNVFIALSPLEGPRFSLP